MNEEVRDIISKVRPPAGPYWRDEGRLDNAYLWTEEERESVLFRVNSSRKPGMKFLRTAAAYTPEDTDVIVVPDIMAVAQIHGNAFPNWRIVMAEFPNTYDKLYYYLHECGHVINEYEKCNDPCYDHSAWTWLREIEAEYFAIRTLAISRTEHWLRIADAEEQARNYMLRQIEEARKVGSGDPEDCVPARILRFIRSETLVFVLD